jgi:hypothetical protein
VEPVCRGGSVTGDMTFSALDGASLAGCFSYLSVATSASGQTLLIKDNGKRFICADGK